MKKRKKSISKKMIIFFSCLIILLLIYIDISFRHQEILENLVSIFIYALIFLSGIGGGLKLGDDIQKSLLYKPEMDGDNEE